MVDKDKTKRSEPSEWIGMDPKGVTWHDLIVLDDEKAKPADRVAAIKWIANIWFKRPIAPQRWRKVGPRASEALKSRAKANGTTREQELRLAVEQALLLALDRADSAGGIFAPGPRQKLWRGVNNLVVEELLGPGWRERPTADIDAVIDEAEELEEFFAIQANQAEIEAVMDLDSRIVKAELTEMEGQVVTAIFHGFQPRDIAATLHKKPGAVRTALSRARKKLRTRTWLGAQN